MAFNCMSVGPYQPVDGSTVCSEHSRSGLDGRRRRHQTTTPRTQLYRQWIWKSQLVAAGCCWLAAAAAVKRDDVHWWRWWGHYEHEFIQSTRGIHKFTMYALGVCGCACRCRIDVFMHCTDNIYNALDTMWTFARGNVYFVVDWRCSNRKLRAPGRETDACRDWELFLTLVMSKMCRTIENIKQMHGYGQVWNALPRDRATDRTMDRKRHYPQVVWRCTEDLKTIHAVWSGR